MNMMGRLLSRRPSSDRSASAPGPKPTDQNGSEREHIWIDEINETIFADLTRRETHSMQALLSDHHRQTGRVFKVIWEPLSDIQRRLVDNRANDAETSATESAETASGRALALLKIAARCQATDLHILKRRTHTLIQFRIKKDLRDYGELNNAEGYALMVAMYRLCSSQDSTIKDAETQDGGIAGEILDGTGLENVRLVRGPSYPAIEGGQHMELRLQYRDKASQSPSIPQGVVLRPPKAPAGKLRLAQYGFTPEQIDRLQNIAGSPSGMLVLTGPTGSGKTSTIGEVEKWKARSNPGKRTISIEQPVELELPHAVQLEISNALSAEEAGKAFRENLRYTLRMDPDRLIIGELRDHDVTLTSFDASQTGHFVLTTLHIEDPFDFPLRFQNMDYERLSFRVTCNSSVIRGVVAQRLLPILCAHCKTPWRPDDERMSREAASALVSWSNGEPIYQKSEEGCPHCQFTGVRNVTAVAEVVQTDEELMNDLVTRGVPVARRRFRSRPGADTSMVEKAIGLAIAGKVDPASIITEVGQIPARDQLELDRARGRAERAQAASEAQAMLSKEDAA